jgi:hypothetical protein
MILLTCTIIATVVGYAIGETRGQKRGHRDCTDLMRLEAVLRGGS